MDAAKIALEFAKALAEATPMLFELWHKLGERDAFLAAVDSMLAVERKRVDEAIRRKHEG
ncbi:MAG TPA: hypothetical protein VM686_37020 [Polyangiaceae bacterium]|jgi:hypothetical protein|nr:hypothetical protein [Polyangiaceae bacterium]